MVDLMSLDPSSDLRRPNSLFRRSPSDARMYEVYMYCLRRFPSEGDALNWESQPRDEATGTVRHDEQR